MSGADPETAARNFLVDNAAVFGLPADYLGDDARLRFENDTPLQDSDGHAIFFRQQFGGLPAVKDGSVIVGLSCSAEVGWDVSYASSSLTTNTSLAVKGTDLTGKQTWLLAANAVGEDLAPADIESATADRLKDDEGLRSDFTELQVEGPRPPARRLRRPRHQATHVQLRVLSNQCTCTPVYQGDPDADPVKDSDCSRGSDQDEVVRAAELQVFSR